MMYGILPTSVCITITNLINNKSMEKDYEARKRIGERIRDIRTELGMTQRDLAEKTGLQQPHIVRIEAGRYSVGLDTLQLIAEALGCKVDIIASV